MRMSDHQAGPHSFGGHIAAGANLLYDCLAPGAILEFSAPTGCGGPRVIAQVASWMEGGVFICRHQVIAKQFRDHVREAGGKAPNIFFFSQVALHLDEIIPLSPFVIFGQDIRWDSIVQSVAEEFCAKGCIVVRVK